jgi:hypothetical protein
MQSRDETPLANREDSVPHHQVLGCLNSANSVRDETPLANPPKKAHHLSQKKSTLHVIN